MIDFHSHILPNIDDGATCKEEAVSMLLLSASQNIDTIIATPHYYDEEFSIKTFLKKRNNSYMDVMEIVETDSINIPKIILGAEVYLTPNTAEEKDLEKLCIEGTNTLLLELPFVAWSDWVYNSIYKIIVQRNLIPVIAHLERYLPLNKTRIENILAMELFIQVNAESICDRKYWKYIKKLLVQNSVHAIGSDAHDMNIRKSMMDTAIHKIVKKLGNSKIEELNNISKKLVGI